MRFKKKFLIVSLYILLLLIITNILHIFFYKNVDIFIEKLKSLPDELQFRKEYYSREIIQTTLDCNYYSQSENVLSTDDISVKLNDINYDKSKGVLKANFDFYMNDGQNLEDVYFKLKCCDKKYLFYDNQVGSTLYIDNLDYLFYSTRTFHKVANKKLNTSKMNRRRQFEVTESDDGIYKKLQLEFNFGENYEIQDKLDIEFLNILYKPLGDFFYKAIEPLGEFKFVINFK